jgi:SAM-dependent methyltransferase
MPVAEFDGESYQARFDALAASGMDVHGEARFVLRFSPRRVLDAGCGTGRVGLELARHGVAVVGVDVDRSMIAAARRRGPGIEWVEADLATMDLGRTFDLVILAGNVPLFCRPEDRPALVRCCAAHVGTGGVLVAGFQLDDRYALSEWDEGCRSAGLSLDERWSTWECGAWSDGSGYAVSVHRRPGK